MNPQQAKLISDLQQLQANLAQTLGQLAIMDEQRHVIREEIAKVQGKLEILNEINTTKEPERN